MLCNSKNIFNDVKHPLFTEKIRTSHYNRGLKLKSTLGQHNKEKMIHNY